MNTKELERRAQKEAVGFIIVVALILLAVCLCGCASVIERDKDGNIVRQIDSRGFLRNAQFKETKPDGTTTELSTESTTSDILLGLDKLTGTLVDGAAKASGAVK